MKGVLRSLRTGLERAEYLGSSWQVLLIVLSGTFRIQGVEMKQFKDKPVKIKQCERMKPSV